MKRKIILFLISVLFCLLMIFFKGLLTNSQTISDMSTYSGGFPFTYFEFYYPKNIELDVSYVMENINRANYKLDIGVFVIDVILVYLLITILANIEMRRRKWRKNISYYNEFFNGF